MPAFDLAIALAALAASSQLPAHQLDQVAHIGELSLDGGVRCPPGLLSTVFAAHLLGFTRVMVPVSGAREAALVPGMRVIAVETLRGAVAWHRGEPDGWHIHTAHDSAALPSASSSAVADTESVEPDFSDVIGQPETVEALVVAAAGRHHVSMVGPPGAGKTLLASRLVSILPDLSPDESILVSRISSLGGAPLHELVRRPPFIAPHHTATKTAIVGGGDTRGLNLGAVTRACHGVLFLDEAPEYGIDVLNALREPLETREMDIQRARFHTILPAHMQLVLAANPCPCGYADSLDSAEPCRCSPSQRIRYLGRISGPLADRIDLKLHVRKVPSMLLDHDDQPRPTSAELRARVLEARQRAAKRLQHTPWKTNSEVTGAWLRWPANKLSRSVTAVLDSAYSRGALSARGYERTLRLSWTLADLAGKTRPERADVRQALILRNGAAL